QLSQRLRLHARDRVQAPDGAGTSEDEPRLRVPGARQRRPVLPDPAAAERRALQEVRSARRRDAGRPLRGPARHVSLLQHGSGRRAGAHVVRARRWTDQDRNARENCVIPLELWGGVECTVNRVGDRYHDQLRRNGHASRLSDLDRFASLGVRALRHPVVWERVAPDGLRAADWSFADASLARLRELGIRPIVTLLHHGSGPRDTSLLDPGSPETPATYARAVAA